MNTVDVGSDHKDKKIKQLHAQLGRALELLGDPVGCVFDCEDEGCQSHRMDMDPWYCVEKRKKYVMDGK